MKSCPFCAEEIQDAAIVCKHCGRDLATGSRPGQNAPTVVVQQTVPSNGVAAVLSLVIPGAGQMYKGHIGTGIVWLIVVPIGYLMFIFPGLVLHFICILSAASTTPATAGSQATAAAPSIDAARQAEIDVAAKERGKAAAALVHGQGSIADVGTIVAPTTKSKRTLLVVLAAAVVVFGATYYAQRQLDGPAGPSLTATVSFNGGSLRVANDTTYTWSGCRLTINQHTEELGALGVGSPTLVASAPFGPLDQNSQVHLHCQSPSSQDGRVYWTYLK